MAGGAEGGMRAILAAVLCLLIGVGPVVVFGAGGIQVEVFADVARLLCPTGEAEVLAELGRLHCARLFEGFRGRPAMDPAPFARAVVRVGQLLVDFPEIAELDLNPVRLTDGGALLALDARLRLTTPATDRD